MNIVTMVKISDGKKFQGFLDWDKMSRKVNFYYYDTERKLWVSEDLTNFAPVPLKEPKSKKVIGG